ncbi:MAG: M20/M25/M40 family metallo-hydrolase [Pseudomonadota bacterium]
MAGIVRWIFGLAAIALTVAGANLAVAPPPPVDAEGGAARFSAREAKKALETLIGDTRPRPLGSKANAAGRARIVDAFERAGFAAATVPDRTCRTAGRRSFIRCAEVWNIVVRIAPGEGPALVLAAHHDSVGAGPGAADDLHAVAVILQAATALRDDPAVRRPVVAIITDGEEEGLFGAKAVFERAGVTEKLGPVINLEARGNQGPSLLFETVADGSWLATTYGKAAPRPQTSSLMQAVYETLPNATDLTMVRRAGVTGANFGFIGRPAHYHTPLDTLDNLDLRSLQHQGDNVLALARAVARADALPTGPRHPLYTDLWTRGFISMPQWVAPTTLVLCIFVLATVAARRPGFSWNRIVGGAVGLPLAAAAGAGLSVAVYRAAGYASPAPGYAYPTLFNYVLLVCAFAGVALVAAVVGRRVGASVVAVGAWIAFCLIGLAAYVAFPGAAVLFVVPAAAAAVILASAHALSSFARWLFSVAAVLAGAVSASFLAPIGFLTSTAVGPEMFWVTTIALSFAITPLVFAAPRPADLGGAALCAIAATAAAGAVLGLRPAYTAERPLPQNILYVEDYRTGTAEWRIPTRRPIPASFRDAAAFSQTVEPGQTGFTAAGFAASSATPAPAERPALTIVDETPVEAGRRLRLAIDGVEDAWHARIYIPEAARPLHVDVGGVRYAFDPAKARNGRHVFICYAPLCGDIDITLGTDEKADWLYGVWSLGLPAAGAPVVDARPSWMTAKQDGDVTIRIAQQKI